MTGVPRYISSMTSAVPSERRATLVAARATGYGIPRCIDGSTPRRCDAPRLVVLLEDLGDRQDAGPQVVVRADEERVPRPAVAEALVGSLIVAIVMYERTASPDTRLPTLAPSLESRPSPFDARRTISAASAGWFETIITWRSFSHQRNAGMKLLLPCRMPAWLAEVCEGSSAVHLSRRIVWLRTHFAMNGTRPARIWCDEDRVGEAVDLDDHDARQVGHDAIGAPARELGHERAVVRLVLVDREDRREDRVEDREEDRAEEAPR